MLEIFHNVYLKKDDVPNTDIDSKDLENNHYVIFSWNTMDKYPNGYFDTDDNNYVLVKTSFLDYLKNGKQFIAVYDFFSTIIDLSTKRPVYIIVDNWSLSEIIYCYARLLFKHPRREALLNKLFSFFDNSEELIEIDGLSYSASRAGEEHCKMLANTIQDKHIARFIDSYFKSIPFEIDELGFKMNKI